MIEHTAAEGNYEEVASWSDPDCDLLVIVDDDARDALVLAVPAASEQTVEAVGTPAVLNDESAIATWQAAPRQAGFFWSYVPSVSHVMSIVSPVSAGQRVLSALPRRDRAPSPPPVGVSLMASIRGLTIARVSATSPIVDPASPFPFRVNVDGEPATKLWHLNGPSEHAAVAIVVFSTREGDPIVSVTIDPPDPTTASAALR